MPSDAAALDQDENESADVNAESDAVQAEEAAEQAEGTPTAEEGEAEEGETSEEASEEEVSEEEASQEEASEEEASEEEASEEEASEEDVSQEEASEEEVDAAPPEPPPAAAESAFRSKRHHVAPALIALDRVDDDEAFRMRPQGEVDRLAQNIARLGQLFPVELRLRPPDRFQIICGFRRVEALRFLQRDKVLARLHTDLSDDDALLMALSAAVDSEPVSSEELAAIRQRLSDEGRLSPAAADMLQKAADGGDDLAPEEVEEEIDADELARQATIKLGEINQDLALLAEVFSSLDSTRKRELLQQLGYSADLVAYLESK